VQHLDRIVAAQQPQQDVGFKLLNVPNPRQSQTCLYATEINPRVLIFSQRNFDLKVFQCWIYEFEDVIAETDGVHLLAPGAWEEAAAAATLIRRVGNGVRRLRGRAPHVGVIGESQVNQKYDLFFAIFMFPWQLALLERIKNWRSQCGGAVCLLGEVWVHDVPRVRPWLELLRDFDQVFVAIKSSVPDVAQVVGKPCTFLPLGIDTLRFYPYPNPPTRSIDVLSMGRRSDSVHQDLLYLAEKKRIFYLYDVVRNFSVIDYREHRAMLANLVKRSRYFISYKHNVNIADVTGGQEAVGARYFEGAAGGAAMIGIPPDCEEYRAAFDWEDAVIPVPYSPTDIGVILSELDAQPHRLARVSRKNVVSCLLRHDWAYRWEQILNSVGIEPTPALAARRATLQKLAHSISVDTGVQAME